MTDIAPSSTEVYKGPIPPAPAYEGPVPPAPSPQPDVTLGGGLNAPNAILPAPTTPPVNLPTPTPSGPASLSGALGGASSPLGMGLGLSPSFESDVARVAPFLNTAPSAQQFAELNKANADVLRAEQSQKIADASAKDKAYTEYDGTAQQALSRYRDEMARSPLPAFVPTQETAGDISMLGGLLAIVGFMAGKGKGLAPGLDALDSMTGMLKGWQQGRKDLYEREYLQFKANFQRVIAAHQEYSRELSTAFETAQIDLTKGLADANLAAVKSGDQVMQAAIRQKGIQGAIQLQQAQKEAMGKAVGLVMAMEAKQAQRLGIQPYDEETLRSMVDQYLAGDKSVVQGMGYGNLGAMNRFAFRQTLSQVMKERNLTGADVASKLSEFNALSAGMRVIGQRSANAELANAEAQRMEKQVRDTASAVNNNAPQLVNKYANAWEAQTGDTDVVKFTAAVNSFVQVYSRLVAPTGVPTESVRAHAYELLHTAMTKDQVFATLDQLNKEMQAAYESPDAAMAIFTSRITGKSLPFGGGGQAQPKGGAPSEGDTGTSKSGRPIIFRNGHWEYADAQ